MRSPASRSILSWYVYTLLSPSYTILYHAGYPSTCEIASPSHQICFVSFQASYFSLFDNVYCFQVFLILHFFSWQVNSSASCFLFNTFTSLSKVFFLSFSRPICTSASTNFVNNSPTTYSVNLLTLGLTSEHLSALELDKGYLKVSSKKFCILVTSLLFPACVCSSFSFNFILLSTFVPYEYIILLVHPTNMPLISHRVVTTKPSLAQLLRIVLFVILEFITLVGNSQH